MIIKNCATLGRLGYLPASGTFGSIVALPCAYFISLVPQPYNFFIELIIFIASFFIIDQALKFFETEDPSQIILDEFVGMLWTLVGFQFNIMVYGIGFILFRLFDIFKPLGISKIEKLPRAYGVLLDDCCAGLFAYLLLRLFVV